MGMLAWIITGVAINPEPTVDFYPDRAAPAIHWSLCAAPGTDACHSIPSIDGTAHPGAQPAGAVFMVTATYRGRTYSSSETWRGRVQAVTRPILHGLRTSARSFGQRGELGQRVGNRAR